jgi:hypothetical protein
VRLQELLASDRPSGELTTELTGLEAGSPLWVMVTSAVEDARPGASS